MYRKPTHTGSYLHFFGNHSDKVKRSVASGLCLRALRTCSPQHLDKEIDTVKLQLTKSPYPGWFLDKALSVARANFYETSPPLTREFCQKKTIKTPCNESICALTKIFPNDKINFIHSYPKSIFF